MRKIVMAGSGKLHSELLKVKKQLEDRGYDVIDYPKKINCHIEEEYKAAFEEFYENMNKADDFLLCNLDKNGVEGYIGYESFAELVYSMVQKIQGKEDKHIYIYIRSQRGRGHDRNYPLCP